MSVDGFPLFALLFCTTKLFSVVLCQASGVFQCDSASSTFLLWEPTPTWGGIGPSASGRIDEYPLGYRKGPSWHPKREEHPCVEIRGVQGKAIEIAVDVTTPDTVWCFNRSDGLGESSCATPQFGPVCMDPPTTGDILQLRFYTPPNLAVHIEILWWLRVRLSPDDVSQDDALERGGWCDTVKQVNLSDCKNPPLFPSSEACPIYPEDEGNVWAHLPSSSPHPVLAPIHAYKPKGMSGGAKAVLVLLVFFILLGGFAWYVVKRRKGVSRFVKMDLDAEDTHDLSLDDHSHFENGIDVSVERDNLVSSMAGQNVMMKENPHHGIGDSDDDDDVGDADYYDEDDFPERSPSPKYSDHPQKETKQGDPAPETNNSTTFHPPPLPHNQAATEEDSTGGQHDESQGSDGGVGVDDLPRPSEPYPSGLGVAAVLLTGLRPDANNRRPGAGGWTKISSQQQQQEEDIQMVLDDDDDGEP
eukprot:gb/GEZN01005580.1/.p1 GENE.gb/GEZN01005580.1/~~gb/GEZN01005580.1/.p1  ORF type:complete len:472 (-),score=86.42 gb/GEZN01005580.1/:323-1738(-)